MNPEPTLGEILGAALAGTFEPVFDPMDAQAIAAADLAAAIAPRLRSDFDEVWDALCRVPDNMLDLLHSPQGWMALASFIASDLGAEPPDYEPTKH